MIKLIFLIGSISIATGSFAKRELQYSIGTEEQKNILTLINELGKDANRFHEKLQVLATLSKEDYLNSLKNLSPELRTIVGDSCAHTEDKDLIIRNICYSDALFKIAQESESDQTKIASDYMVDSVSKMIRWSILFATCNKKTKDTCSKLKKWGPLDFVPQNAQDIEYVPNATPSPNDQEETKKDEGDYIETPIDCSKEAKLALREKLRTSSALALTMDSIELEQRLYACRVEDYHSKNQSAQLLARTGMDLVYIIKNIKSCSDVMSRISMLNEAYKQQYEAESSESLGRVIQDLEQLRLYGCDEIERMASDSSLQGLLIGNFCTWKSEIELKSKGSTVGFSSSLVPCGN